MKSIEKQQIIIWLKQYYGLQTSVDSQMEGYGSTNYKISTSSTSYVLKIYDYSLSELCVIKEENELLLEFGQNLSIQLSQPIQSLAGQHLVILEENSHILRLLSYVEGKFWADQNIKPSHIESLGATLAQIDHLLIKSYKASIASKKMDWDPLRLSVLYSKLHHIQDRVLQNQIHYFLSQTDQLWSKRLIHLPQQLIYNDAHEWNILVDENELSGIIDLGDMIYSCRINELAVAGAYIVMNNCLKDPLVALAYLLQSYHKLNELQEQEIEALYYLISLRACMSLLNGAEISALHPQNEYLDISSEGARRLIKSWLEINPIHFTNRFKKRLGFIDTEETSQNLSRVLQKRKQYIPESFSLSYQNPLHIKHAAFQYIYDPVGNRILDAYNNIIHVGHCHPKVVEASNRMMSRINTNTRYVYEELGEYAEKLTAYFPEHLNKVFFVNSGSAASDLAVRLSTHYTGNKKIISMEHGYHGNTQLGIDISHYKYASKGGMGYSDRSIALMMPDEYKGVFSNETNPGPKYAQEAIKVIEAQDQEFAAFIAEPIIGCGGQVPLAKAYLSELYPYLQKKGILCISDEVQVGFGRLGSNFWGFEMHGVIPDIVILGKPIGNGHPMAAVVTTSEIAEAFNNGMEFFSSFGGNPVSCAVGQAVLEVIDDEKLQLNAEHTGTYLMAGYNELKKSFPVIGDVRGQGLFIGIELVKDPHLKNPDTALASFLCNELRNQHVLVSTDGPYNQVIKIKPPLCFNRSNVDEVIEKTRAILNRYRP